MSPRNQVPWEPCLKFLEKNAWNHGISRGVFVKVSWSELQGTDIFLHQGRSGSFGDFCSLTW